MTSEQIFEMDADHVMQTYSRFPVALESGQGARVWSPEGQEYIDFTCGIGVTCLGHSYPAWSEAVSVQASRLAHTSNLYYTEPSTKLASRLCRISGMKRVFFGNSGAEANEGAIKAARKYSFMKYPGQKRSTVVTIKNSFHGRTITTLAATGQEHFHDYFFPFTKGFKYTDGDIESVKSALSEDVCALMLEVVQGEGGVLPLDSDFLQSVQKIAHERDILLIIDEVQTGIGRTGDFFAFQGVGLEPDIVTVAKALGGGLPIGAFICNEKTADVLQKGDHGSTFGANLIACAGANVIVETVSNEDFLDGVRLRGEYITKKILDMGIPFIKGVRGRGLLLGVMLDESHKNGVLAMSLAEAGLLVLTAGQNVIRLMPPLNIRYEDIDAGLDIFARVAKKG